jgi:hypothetical protein
MAVGGLGEVTYVLDEHGALSDLALCDRVSFVRLQNGPEWGSARIPVTISTLSLEMSLTGCSPSEDMVWMDVWGWFDEFGVVGILVVGSVGVLESAVDVEVGGGCW